MWNNEYIFVGCNDKTIKLIELNNGKIINELRGHNDYVISIKNAESLESFISFILFPLKSNTFIESEFNLQ